MQSFVQAPASNITGSTSDLGQKIAEIQINGDNQKIRLPHNLIKWNQDNIITIRAGRNLMQAAYVDYDDIEFMNISVQ